MLKKLFKLLFRGLRKKSDRKKAKKRKAFKRKLVWGLVKCLFLVGSSAAVYFNRSKIKDKILALV